MGSQSPLCLVGKHELCLDGAAIRCTCSCHRRPGRHSCETRVGRSTPAGLRAPLVSRAWPIKVHIALAENY